MNKFYKFYISLEFNSWSMKLLYILKLISIVEKVLIMHNRTNKSHLARRWKPNAQKYSLSRLKLVTLPSPGPCSGEILGALCQTTTIRCNLPVYMSEVFASRFAAILKTARFRARFLSSRNTKHTCPAFVTCKRQRARTSTICTPVTCGPVWQLREP